MIGARMFAKAVGAIVGELDDDFTAYKVLNVICAGV
jgi:hypothetical protein